MSAKTRELTGADIDVDNDAERELLGRKGDGRLKRNNLFG
jgi:hypothetical protein